MATISRESYEALLQERKALIEKLTQAAQDGEEFMANHYKRLLTVTDRTYHSAMKQSISLERRELREKLSNIMPKEKGNPASSDR